MLTCLERAVTLERLPPMWHTLHGSQFRNGCIPLHLASAHSFFVIDALIATTSFAPANVRGVSWNNYARAQGSLRVTIGALDFETRFRLPAQLSRRRDPGGGNRHNAANSECNVDRFGAAASFPRCAARRAGDWPPRSVCETSAAHFPAARCSITLWAGQIFIREAAVPPVEVEPPLARAAISALSRSFCITSFSIAPVTKRP